MRTARAVKPRAYIMLGEAHDGAPPRLGVGIIPLGPHEWREAPCADPSLSEIGETQFRRVTSEFRQSHLGYSDRVVRCLPPLCANARGVRLVYMLVPFSALGLAL